MKKHKHYFKVKTKIVLKRLLKLKMYKIIKKNVFISKSLKQRSLLKSFRISQVFNISKLKKFCIITGKLRFVINNQKFSRSVFREYCSFGLISGIYKK